MLDNSGDDFERNSHDFYSFSGQLGSDDNLLNVVMKQNPGQWVINYVSDGSGALPTAEFAKYLNQWVADFIAKHDLSGHKHYGTVLFDFPTRVVLQKLQAKYLG